MLLQNYCKDARSRLDGQDTIQGVPHNIFEYTAASIHLCIHWRRRLIGVLACIPAEPAKADGRSLDGGGLR